MKHSKKNVSTKDVLNLNVYVCVIIKCCIKYVEDSNYNK